MKIIKEGELIPKFYVPLRYRDFAREVECYHILIVPIVAILILTHNLWRYFWRDVLQIINIMDKGLNNDRRTAK